MHRRKADVPLRRITDHWRGRRSRLVAELRPRLGYTRYSQTYRCARLNPLYVVLRLSRSRLGETVFFPSRLFRSGSSSAGGLAGGDEWWDVVDEFWFPSAHAVVRAFDSDEGREAARLLREDQSRHTRRTAVVVGEERVVCGGDRGGGSDARVLYMLRGQPDMDADEVRDYWGGEHRRLVERSQRGMGFRAFEQVHGRSDDVLARVGEALGADTAEEYHGVASLCFGRPRTLVLNLLSPFGVVVNRKVLADELRFLDAPRCSLVFGRQRVFHDET
jgi:hypothetical protein